MSYQITVQVEARRGCGFRKPSKNGVGVYLVGPDGGAPCGRLPWLLEKCCACSGGVKPSRSWTWIEPRKLFEPLDRTRAGAQLRCSSLVAPLICAACPLGAAMPEGRHGLLWVGEGFYGKPEAFTEEARRMGVSRKLSALPRGFELGKTIVYLAHRLAVDPVDRAVSTRRRPGVFSVFKPTGIDLVVEAETAAELPDAAKRLADAHPEARLVRVVREERLYDEPVLPLVDPLH